MSKRKRAKEAAKLKYTDRIVYGVNLSTNSRKANLHNIRSLQNTLNDLQIPATRLNYIVNGVNIYAFQSDYKHREIIKKLCAKYDVEFVLACIYCRGKYAVFKENVNRLDREKDGTGWVIQLTKTEAEGYETYLYDDEGHYFIIHDEEVIKDKAA